jgi:hypothetical protein
MMTSQSHASTDSDKRRNRARVAPKSVQRFTEGLLGEELHAKRVLSIALAVTGVLQAANLAIHAIGRGLAAARGRDAKHGTKQVDRLLSNDGIALWRLFDPWVRFVVGDRKQIVVALDWTEFDKDGHATICLYLITRHGRATPLVWKTVEKATLAGTRNAYEKEVIDRLHSILPPEVELTMLADRGFGDQKLYTYLQLLGWDFIIRFREGILVTDALGQTRPATEWLAATGRAKMLKGARVTDDKTEVPAVVLVHDKRMKDAWCLATSRTDLGAAEVARLYGRRFTIEETFRDQKDGHFGMGLSATHIGTAQRRDRLLFLAALAYALLVLLGAAGERAGLDRTLKANTVKRRTLSLYKQGCFWYEAIPALSEERFNTLMTAYDECVREHAIFREIFGLL